MIVIIPYLFNLSTFWAIFFNFFFNAPRQKDELLF